MFHKRTKIMKFICVFLFGIISIRLMYIGIFSGKTLKTMALIQHKREIEVESIRGNITDRNGVSFTCGGVEKLYLTSDARLLKENSSSCVFEFEKEKRAPEAAKHLVGYTSPDGEGKSGIEKEYNNILKTKGKFKLNFVSDVSGKPAGGFELKKEEAKDKTDIRLTLDYNMQAIAENVMDKYIKRGALVLLDSRNFDVLAMVSRPDFESNKISDYETSPHGELLNRALLGYNAGSVFKIVTAAAALEKTEEYTQRYFDCRGSYDLGDGHIFFCNKKEGHGVLYFPDAFAKSCNCSFYVSALETGAKNIVAAAQKFGMGAGLLNMELGEAEGNLPLRSLYSNAETLNISIGQGEILISPLQCAVMAATVANKGIRRDVNIVDSVVKNGTSESVKKTGEVRVMENKTAMLLSDMMRRCVTDGTGYEAFESSVSIAGKTGTAESGWIEDGKSLVHGWFCGFFPYENPEYAMAIISEGGGSGAESCVEPFVEIAEKICG